MMGGISMRTLLKGGVAAGLGGAMVSFGPAFADDGVEVRIQFDWLLGNGQLGDIVAQQKGFFKEEGLTVVFGPGGPNA